MKEYTGECLLFSLCGLNCVLHVSESKQRRISRKRLQKRNI